jgi:CheY-like chemotaxis protein
MYIDRKPRVLVVEDEAMVSMLIEDMVCDFGAEVVGPAAKFERAMTLALEAEFDLAVLDVNLDGLEVYPIADLLRHRGIPFIVMTGYDSSVVPQRYQHNHVLSKPFSQQTFSGALELALAKTRCAGRMLCPAEAPERIRRKIWSEDEKMAEDLS